MKSNEIGFSEEKIIKECEELILSGVKEFFVAGESDSDRALFRALLFLKRKYPHIKTAIPQKSTDFDPGNDLILNFL